MGGKASGSIEKRVLPVEHQPEAAEMGGVEKGAELRGMEEVTIETEVDGKVVREKDGDATVGQISEKPKDDDVPPPRASSPLDRLPPPETAAAGGKRLDGPTEPATDFAVTGTAALMCAPPATKSAGSDLSATSDHSRSLGGSAPVDGPLGRDATGMLGNKVTPKVFKDVAARLRTPVTGMDRFECPRGKVRTY